MEFEKVLQGLERYIRGEMMTTMTIPQKLGAETFIFCVDSNSATIKNNIMKSEFLKILGISIDENQINVDEVMRCLKHAFTKYPIVEISPPFMGKYKFVSSDLDKLYQYIMEG